MTYSVYVGNLPTTVSTEQLKNLFSQVGEVLDVWINPLNALRMVLLNFQLKLLLKRPVNNLTV